jgi:hypothetical protein
LWVIESDYHRLHWLRCFTTSRGFAFLESKSERFRPSFRAIELEMSVSAMNAAPDSSPLPTVCSGLGALKNRPASRMDGKPAMSVATIYRSDQFSLLLRSLKGLRRRTPPELTVLRLPQTA